MIVKVTGRQVWLPERCACCLSRPDRRVPSQRRRFLFLVLFVYHRTYSLSIPYCETCARHADEARPRTTFLLALGFFALGCLGSLILVLPTLWALRPLASQSPLAAGALAVFERLFWWGPVLATAVYLIWVDKSRARPLGPPHTARGQAVEIVKFSSREATLRVYNDAFAGLLLASNPGVRALVRLRWASSRWPRQPPSSARPARRRPPPIRRPRTRQSAAGSN